MSTIYQHLKQALDGHRNALEELEAALLEFEATLAAQEGPQQRTQEGQ
jgi:hypothetical protein